MGNKIDGSELLKWESVNPLHQCIRDGNIVEMEVDNVELKS